MNRIEIMENRNRLMGFAMQDVSERVHQLMESEGISKTDVARLFGLSVGEVDSILECDNISLKSYVTVLAAFGLTISVMSIDAVRELEESGETHRFEPGRSIEPSARERVRESVRHEEEVSSPTPRRDSRGRFTSNRNHSNATAQRRDSRGRFLPREEREERINQTCLQSNETCPHGDIGIARGVVANAEDTIDATRVTIEGVLNGLADLVNNNPTLKNLFKALGS